MGATRFAAYATATSADELRERHIDQPEPLYPANAQTIAEFAEETGTEVLWGALRYPSESGGWQLGDIDLSEHLGKGQDCDLAFTIFSGPELEIGS